MGARAAWALGHVGVLIPDDEPTLATNVPILLERAFGGKTAANSQAAPADRLPKRNPWLP